MKKVLFAVTLLVFPAVAQVLPRAAPETVGMSSERLGRIDTVIQRQIDEHRIAGAVALVARRGRIVHLGAYGMADIEANRPMKEDTIFRIASMSKPITSVAAMMLYEEGKFMLSDPVGDYLPEFAHMNVLPSLTATNNYRTPATRPITIRHLLTHTSGLTYHWNPRLGKLYYDYGITHGLVQDPSTIREKMKVLAGLPLLFNPGDRFEYGLSIDVLGALVEAWSGLTLDQFFKQRIFGPLGMPDSAFFQPGKSARYAAVYAPAEGGGLKRAPKHTVENGTLALSTDYPYEGPTSYYSGGGGLSSTALDYARFAQMILNGGELDGHRLLSPKTVELMSMDHARKIAGDEAPSFGLGFYVESATDGFPELTSEGTFGWGGFWYTQFFISPAEEMIGVFMGQLHPDGGLKLNQQLKVLAHQAIIE